MELLREIKEYSTYIKQNRYLYEVQHVAIDLLIEYTTKEGRRIASAPDLSVILDYFLAVWLPRRKKYLNEQQALNMIDTIQAFQTYVENKYNILNEVPIVLQQYGETYKRMYGIKEVIRQVTEHPVLSINPDLIDMQNYKKYKLKQSKKERMMLYEQGYFVVSAINPEGSIIFCKLHTNKLYKMMFSPKYLTCFKVSDIIQASFKRKIFFVYWEIEQMIAYYPAQAQHYL